MVSSQLFPDKPTSPASAIEPIDSARENSLAVQRVALLYQAMPAALVAGLVGQREREEREVGQRVAVAPFPQRDRLARRPFVDAAHEGVRARRGDEVAGDIRKGRGVGQGRRTSTSEVGDGVGTLRSRGGGRTTCAGDDVGSDSVGSGLTR